MAKIEKVPIVDAQKSKKIKKRKNKEDSKTLESESPSSKFKKLDLSQVKWKKGQPQQKPVVQQIVADKQNNKKTKVADDKPTNKRKTNDSSSPKAKKSKQTSKNKVRDAGDDDDDGDGEIREPTLSEINESLKPENLLDIETIRQKKRVKHQKIVEVNKVDTVTKEFERNTQYLQTWKTNRSIWKFEKLRQISIQKNLFNVDKIDDDLWLLIVDYLSTSKGASRDNILKNAEETLQSLDSKITDANNQEMISSKKYVRAREILQTLQ